MPRSRFASLTIVLGFVLTVGCTKPEKQDTANGDADRTATFKVATGKAEGWGDPVLTNDVWQKPMSTTFRFTACLKDRSRDTDLQQQPFAVEDPVTHQRTDDGTYSTNNEGCLIWTEPVAFNYFAMRSRWVTVDRDIIGAGSNTGRRRVSFAINPWLAANREEMKETHTGYFLRDQQLDLKNPQTRMEKVLEFLRASLHLQSGKSALSANEQKLIEAWKTIYIEGTESANSLLAPTAKALPVLSGLDEGNAEIYVKDVSLLSLKTSNIAVNENQSDPEQGYLVQQTISLQPMLKIRRADGAVEYEKITEGDFDIYIQMVATNAGFDQNKKLILSESLSRANVQDPAHPESPKGAGRVVDGELIGYVNFKINKKVAEGNLDVVLKLVPRRIGNRAPKAYEGVFNGGKLNSWVGGKTSFSPDRACIQPGDPDGCTFEGYLSKTANFAEMKAKREATAAEPYQFSNIKARFVQVDSGDVVADEAGQLKVLTGETATRRTVLYSASTCVTDTSGERLARQKFVIRYLGGSDANGNSKPIEKTTDDTGCILWTNTITHGYYKPEKFFRQVISIEGPGGAKRVKNLYINPWDDKFTFGFDEEELGREFFERIAKRARIPSRFYMGDYGYHTVRFLYEIDPYMDLEVKKTVLMHLQPQVLRYSGIISGRKVTEYLRDGIYLLKVGIQKSYLDPSDRFHKFCEVDRARVASDKSGRLIEHWERATVDDPQLCNLSRDQRRLSLDDQDRANQQKLNSSLEKFEDSVTTKDFIATKETLVRVTDGLIIQPVELSMKDLRLMRIRSNFLIELETVDERKVLYNDQLGQQYQKLVAEMLADRRKKQEEFRAKSSEQPKEEDIEKDRKALDDLVVKAAAAKRDYFRDLYVKELARLDQPGDIVSDFNRKDQDLNKLLERFQLVKSPLEDLKDKDPAVQEDMRRLYERYQIYSKMAQNDFTKTGLPDCDKVNCDDFKEKESGLDPRTFVGPVIFLSNSYRDAMRATDNLDEARCHEQIEGVDYQPDQVDAVERELLGFESTLLTKRSEELLGLQNNNAYRYNKYFNSLRQFCVRTVPPETAGGRSKVEFYAKQVDDLIHEEKALKQEYQDKMKALATPYNFATIYNLDFVSFGGEKLKKIDEKLIKANCAMKGIENCMAETDERTFQPNDLVSMVNSVEECRDCATSGETEVPIVDRKVYSLKDVKQAIFGHEVSGEEAKVSCLLLASLAGNEFERQLQGGAHERKAVENLAYAKCTMMGTKGFFRDRKLRIYGTGDYVFMGGMQLNFNVGSSFGVSRSTSASASVDFLDTTKQMLGPASAIAVGAVAGTAFGGPVGMAAGGLVGLAGWAFKPFDLKRGWSMSSSNGTSVSEGTYLVGQIAKFSIPLKEWEQCSIVRLHPEAVQAIANSFGKHLWGAVRSPDSELYSRFVGSAKGEVDERARDHINTIFGRGLFICDGIHRTKEVDASTGQEKLGKDIEELYFYFTQHFTEGDMLDQADLYNHPWLLSLRGLRDFQTFVSLIRGQEVVGTSSFIDGFTSNRPHPESEDPGWALDHMANTYKAILPSFPGLYTVLEGSEGMEYFPLKSKRYSFRDFDINSEVNRAVEFQGRAAADAMSMQKSQ